MLNIGGIFMTPNELMNKISKEADEQTTFYKEISNIAETKNKLKCIELLMNHYGCEFDEARIVMDFVIDKIPLPSTLSPQQQAHNQAVAREALNKPKCPTCSSTNIHKISTISKTTNTVMFGVFGTKRHKTFSCKNCGYEW